MGDQCTGLSDEEGLMSTDDRIFRLSLTIATVGILAACGLRQPLQQEDVTSSGRALFVRGQKVYDVYCLACHQRSGVGVPRAFPPLAQAPILDDKVGLIKVTLFGRPGTAMPNHCNFDSADIAAVLTYVRNAWTSKPKEPISSEDVARVSADLGNPTCEPLYKK